MASLALPLTAAHGVVYMNFGLGGWDYLVKGRSYHAGELYR